MPKPYPHRDYRGEPLSRRALLSRAAGVAGVTAAAGYLAFAPEHHALSLRDRSGRRGLPVPTPFTLPDFRVAGPQDGAGVAVGVGRVAPERIADAGTVMQALRKALDAIGGVRRYISPGDVVLLKPNVAFDRSPILGATTSPTLLAALIRLLRVDARAAEVRVTDNPIESPADCFAKSGIRAAADAAGARVYLPDSNAFDTLATPGATLIGQWSFLRRPFAGVDKVIGVAPVKDHNLCSASLGIKNWYGLLGGRRNQFHQDIHEIVSDLSIMIRPTLSILDGTRVLMANGPTGGDPADVRNAGAIVAGTDPVAADAWAYQHLLERRDPPAYLARAAAKGGGRADYRGRVREVK